MRQYVVDIGLFDNAHASGTAHCVHVFVVRVHVLVGCDYRGCSFLRVDRLYFSCTNVEHVLVQLAVCTLHDVLCHVACNAGTVAAPETFCSSRKLHVYETSWNSGTVNLALVFLYIVA